MGDPRERWQQIQRSFRGGNFPKGPKISGPLVGAVIVIGGGVVASNALFNGILHKTCSAVVVHNHADESQLMVVIEPSNIPE